MIEFIIEIHQTFNYDVIDWYYMIILSFIIENRGKPLIKTLLIGHVNGVVIYKEWSNFLFHYK